MVKLEQIKKDAQLLGIQGEEIVRVVQLEPVGDHPLTLYYKEGESYRFAVRVGIPPVETKTSTKAARGANFNCFLSSTPMDGKHIKDEGIAGRMGARLMAIVAEGKKGQVYLLPKGEMEEIAKC